MDDFWYIVGNGKCEMEDGRCDEIFLTFSPPGLMIEGLIDRMIDFEQEA
jgi:hypothetical protein